MTPDRWEQIKQLFHAALDHEPAARPAFLARACADDESLRREVESLVSSHDLAGNFIETPASDVAAELLAEGRSRLSARQNIGHYTITSLLGAGGMGEVYLARDEVLGRQVAVKILNEKFGRHESNLQRLTREAKVASALNHPNILVIHEIGEADGARYIVSEYIEGKTLRDIIGGAPMKLADVLDVAVQIAHALAVAHGAHLVHRDIKPENVMVRPDGYVKILDFGLAKLVEQRNRSLVGWEDVSGEHARPGRGLILGTVNYMSPEQAGGERVDARTDIFSFGVMIYEMVTGRTPFAGDSMAETVANLFNAEPPPLSRFAADAPDGLQRIVSRTLRKNRDERYQTMEGLLADLKELKEDLAFKEKLERSTAAVPKVSTGGHRFKQNQSDTDSHQPQISEPVNAFQAYELWRYHYQQIAPADLIKARLLLEEAVRLDPDFALAHAALAVQSVQEAIVGLHTPAESFPQARAALRRASDLDSSSAEFYAAAGFIDMVCDWNFTEAEWKVRKALELNPHYAFANNYLGQIFMFRCQPDEAEPYLRRAREIEPMGLHNNIVLIMSYFLARNYGKVIEECESALALYPRYFIAAQVRCWALEQSGRAAEAVAEYEKILAEPHGEIARRWMGHAYALVGDRANALETAARLEVEGREHYLSPTHLAQLYAGLNETDEAFLHLEDALRKRDPWMLWIAADPRYDNLRGDSRFDELVRRVGFDGAKTATDSERFRENPSAEEESKRFAPSESKNTTAVLPAATGARVKQTAETQNSFSQTINRHQPLAALALVALLTGAISLGYYFLSANKSAAGAGGKKSIAVLPLKPIGAATRDEIYEIGIADSLIHRLGSMRGFVVRPLSATRKYADIDQDPLAAGKEQRADYVLASNYQLAGGKIRVTSQLFNVASGQIEETYKSEKDAGDVFAMQDAIADEVGIILSSRFAATSSSTVAKRGTTNEEAYRLYLQGMFLYDKRTAPDARKAVEVLDQAVRVDPNYALAWAGKAHAHRYAANLGRSINTHEEYKKSIEAINKALALDANLSEAYSALCENKYYYEYDFDGAARACQRAIELDPNSSMAHQIYSRYLMSRGRHDEAISEIKTAVDLEPTSLFNQRNLGCALYHARRYEEAVAQFKRVIAMGENFGTTYGWLILTLESQGNQSEAFKWFMKFQASQRADEETVQAFQTAYQTSGWQGVLREQAKRFDKVNAAYFYGVGINAQLGNKDEAFEYLEKAYQRREWGLAYLRVDPRLDNLRGDPRFDELVRRVGLK